MCSPAPGAVCADDTRERVACACARYDAAYPDGPAVGPLTAATVTVEEVAR